MSQPSKPHELWFPFNLALGPLCSGSGCSSRPSASSPTRPATTAWNRGAYLVLGPGHCAECHTPRTFYGVLERDRAFAGAQLGKEKVPNITPTRPPASASGAPSDIGTVLQLGMTPNGDFVGSDMAKVVNNGTSKLPDSGSSRPSSPICRACRLAAEA